MRVALKSGTGLYVGAVNGGGGPVVGDRREIGPDETFTMTRSDSGSVSFQTRTGHYLSTAAGGLKAMSTTFEFEAVFHLIDLGNQRYALQIHRKHWYVRGGPTVTIGRGPIEQKDEFELVDVKTGWMEANYPQIKDKTLAQLCLPGTHDSGTYELFDILAPDATPVVRELWNKARVGGATGIGPYIKGMAVTQSRAKTFYRQLEDGIRYIDLRVCLMEGRLYTCHSLRGHLISTLLQDVRRFLDENSREIVVFKVGFKSMSDAQIGSAWGEMGRMVGPHYNRPQNISEVIGKRFSELVEGPAPKRAVFLLATDFAGIYSSSITTNQAVVENLRRNTTEAFRQGRLLEAQCIRPISDTDFIRGYIQQHGCRLLGVIPLLVNPIYMPIVSPLMLAILAGMGTVLPAYLLYVRNFDPRPTDLVQNARDARSILRDYVQWLANSAVKPQVLHCDFYEELPLVEICIRISIGQPFRDLVNGVADQRPTPPLGDRMVIFQCTGQAIAAAFKTAGYAIQEAGNWLLTQLGLGSRPLNQALHAAGYAGREIVRFFNGLGGEFRRFFSNLGRILNPRNWFRLAADPNAPRTTADAFIDRLEDDDFREDLLPAFAEVPEGDWEAFAQMARTAGYEVTAEELARAVPEGFFLGAGTHPELGWDRATLPG